MDLSFLLAALARSSKALIGLAGSGAVVGLSMLSPTWAGAAAVVVAALIYIVPNADINGDGKVDAREAGEYAAGVLIARMPELVAAAQSAPVVDPATESLAVPPVNG